MIRETITVNVVSGTTIRKLKKAIAAQCSVFVSEEARRAAASRAEVRLFFHHRGQGLYMLLKMGVGA